MSKQSKRVMGVSGETGRAPENAKELLAGDEPGRAMSGGKRLRANNERLKWPRPANRAEGAAPRCMNAATCTLWDQAASHSCFVTSFDMLDVTE